MRGLGSGPPETAGISPALPLRRGDGNGAVVVVVAARLLANEVLDLAAVLRLPVEGRCLEQHAAVGHHVFRSKITSGF